MNCFGNSSQNDQSLAANLYPTRHLRQPSRDPFLVHTYINLQLLLNSSTTAIQPPTIALYILLNALSADFVPAPPPPQFPRNMVLCPYGAARRIIIWELQGVSSSNALTAEYICVAYTAATEGTPTVREIWCTPLKHVERHVGHYSTGCCASTPLSERNVVVRWYSSSTHQ